MSPAPLILAVTGPTAVGKTAVALRLADRLAADIISLDSAMVYRGMDIGTAKPAPEVLARYPHALVDIRDPAQPYSVADFLADADAAVRRALDLGRTPLLVGGTMLYLKAFSEGLAAMPGADAAVRSRLRERAAALGWPALHARLAEIDPRAAGRIHPHNAARIERALEVFEVSGRPMSSFWTDTSTSGASSRHHARFEVFAIEPDSRAALHERIARRCHAMFEAGLVAEVAALHGRGDLNADLPAIRAVDYRQIWDYLEGRGSEAQARERVLAATRQLAKRQFTWLKSFGLRTLTWGPADTLAARVLELARPGA